MKRQLIKVRVEPGAYIALAAALLLLPVDLVLGALICCAVHELSHLATIWAQGLTVYEITLGIRGAKILTQPLSTVQELICALAGPLGGLIPAIFARKSPIMALCALVLSAYNLIPLYPYDGGRALRSTLALILPAGIAEKLYTLLANFFMICLIALALYCWRILSLGIFPVILAACIIITTQKAKNTLQTEALQGTIAVS